MNITDFIGYCAAILTTISFIPQVYKIWKTKSTKDVSLIMFLLFSLGIASWLVYGIMIGSYPMILTNVITLILSLIILYFKLKYK